MENYLLSIDDFRAGLVPRESTIKLVLDHLPEGDTIYCETTAQDYVYGDRVQYHFLKQDGLYNTVILVFGDFGEEKVRSAWREFYTWEELVAFALNNFKMEEWR